MSNDLENYIKYESLLHLILFATQCAGHIKSIQKQVWLTGLQYTYNVQNFKIRKHSYKSIIWRPFLKPETLLSMMLPQQQTAVLLLTALIGQGLICGWILVHENLNQFP